MLEIPEIKITVRLEGNSEHLKKVTSSRDAYKVFLQCFDSETFLLREEFLVLCINNEDCVIGFYRLSVGGMTGTVVDLRILFTVALQSLATSIIIAHNHPSGSLIPSEADITLTQKIKEAGIFLDIPLLDHLILTQDDYFSFVDEGLLT
ncbi:RadC family protein [Flavobacterium sp. NKUCC04_CG]|uniref:JAB domain-containing protein n=1 Tax=Flavobacterium sp. NKUCC04_CG TaxID=2842121 RepID=UPI001C5AF743|nr:JAB domain-containing protein [Flavobacterium sp. NKUCC04_CG]MBW3519501.1 JAB domain-containing protein [Flavobacterium sp. NKUCC04_CG]